MSQFVKGPNAVLDWKFDWTAWLSDGETITSHTATAETGLTVASSSATASTVTVWLSGGTAGTTYRINCQVVTSAGRTEERSFRISTRSR